MQSLASRMPKRKRCKVCGDLITLVSIHGAVVWRHSNRNLKRICDNRKAKAAEKTSD